MTLKLPRRHSFSSIEQFGAVCERQYFYERVLKLKRPPSPALIKGNIWHTALEEFIKHRDLDKAVGKATASSYSFQNKWLGYLENVLKQAEEDILGHIPTNAAVLVEKRHYTDDWSGKLDLELDRTLIPDEYGLKVKGTEPQPSILDWKIKTTSGARLAPGSNKYDRVLRQLMFYCKWRGCYSGTVVELDWKGERPPLIYTESFKEKQLEDNWRWYEEQRRALISRKLEEGAFSLAKPGEFLCCQKWCDYWDRCPGGGNGQ